MQAHLASVLKGVVKDKSKGALSRLLGERAAASRLLERIEDGATWHARIGIVLVDDARLPRTRLARPSSGRCATRRISVGVPRRHVVQPAAGLEVSPCGGVVSRTALLDRDAARGRGPVAP